MKLRCDYCHKVKDTIKLVPNRPRNLLICVACLDQTLTAEQPKHGKHTNGKTQHNPTGY